MDGPTTFREEAAFWLARNERVFSPGYLKKARGVLAELDEVLGGLPPANLHPGFLSDVQREQLDRGLSWKTVNHKLQVVNAVLNFSVRSRRIPLNPAVGLQKIKGARPAMRFWERREAEAFLAFTGKKYPPGSAKRWVHVAYLTAINTGVRAGELWGLQPRDLVAGGELLKVQRKFDRVSRTFREPKGKRARLVPCNAELSREIQAVIAAKGTKFTEPIFCHEPGRPLWHEVFRAKYFDRDVAEAGILAIKWLVAGFGYEITGADILAAYSSTMKAADHAGVRDAVRERLREIVGMESRSKLVKELLERELRT